MEYFVIILFFLVILKLTSKVNKLEDRVKRMQHTVDQVAKDSEMHENPIDLELRKLINEGKDIKAVKKARQTLGLSLLEGKEYIDKLKSAGDSETVRSS
ncbi:hypothetical protein GKZ89_17590 [Bacillus mangrovi]|uniref:Ribosomal protein L7/L12 C-terminal domain-containing protein n=1 Tax=Metabacillus mangrovi TaxID=1491830 RepID=A0A7X2V677_9BACI|nr:hypothetical protein [Metabacillus mangrovi]MTH55215.1 hypothetical protein [Metabacillus mangrovi]